MRTLKVVGYIDITRDDEKARILHCVSKNDKVVGHQTETLFVSKYCELENGKIPDVNDIIDVRFRKAGNGNYYPSNIAYHKSKQEEKTDD